LHYSVPAPNGFRYCTLPDRWALSSQYWPNLPPWKIRSLGQPYVSFQWGDILSRFQPFSDPGVVAPGRESVTWNFSLLNPLQPALYQMTAFTRSAPAGRRYLSMQLRLAASFPLLPYDYTAVYYQFAYPGVDFQTNAFVLQSAWDSVNGIDVSPVPAHWYPALLGEVGVF